MKINPQTVKAGSILAAAFVFDQVTKYFLYRDVGDGFVRLVTLENSGAIFGFFQGNNSVILFLSFIVLGVIWYYRNEIKPLWAPYVIIGAGLGNIADRILFGYVRDFMAIGSFSVFNGADTLLTLTGIIVLGYELVQNSSKSFTSSK